MKVSGLLRTTAQRLSRARLHYGHGAHNAREEAGWLVASVLGLPLDLQAKVTPEERRKFDALIRRRIGERIPLAYLLKQAWLGEHSFYIDKRAVVPRSFIAELLRDRLRPWLTRDPRRALDLCTGSGCLAVLLALTFGRSLVDAADLSKGALAVAWTNVNRYRMKKRINLVKSDLFESLQKWKYDLIVSNPPYVIARSMKKLPKEYRHEPSMALAGGKDGLALVHRTIAQARDHLAPGGLLVCEIGGNRRALERAYPELDFIWPETSEGPGCVFILEYEQLPRAARRGAATRTPPRPVRARR